LRVTAKSNRYNFGLLGAGLSGVVIAVITSRNRLTAGTA
jgi:hypothetical protein